jgi:hypothetical protein
MADSSVDWVLGIDANLPAMRKKRWKLKAGNRRSTKNFQHVLCMKCLSYIKVTIVDQNPVGYRK